MNNRKAFVFYKEWKEAIKDLPDDIRLEIYESIIEYAATGDIQGLKPMAKVAFNFIKADIDRDIEKYVSMAERNKSNGNKGGRPKTQNNPENPVGFSETQNNPSKPKKAVEEEVEVEDYISPLSPNGDISPLELPEAEKSENPILSSNQKKEKSCAKKEIREIIPPSLEMVSEYCKERNNNVDPWRFINFYAAKGWMIGKSKMKDWQAAVRTWENNSSPADNSRESKTSKFSKIRQNVERNLIPNGQFDKNHTGPEHYQ